MGNSNGVISVPISLHADVYPVLGLVKTGTYYDVGYVCSNAHGKTNMWSKHKPMRIGDLGRLSEVDMYDFRYGIENIPYYDNFNDMVQYMRTGSPAAPNCAQPYFNYTMEGAEYYRLADFYKYWHGAPAPVDVLTKTAQAEKYYNGIVLPNFGRYMDLHIKVVTDYAAGDDYLGITVDDLRIMGSLGLFALNSQGVAIEFQRVSYDTEGNYYFRTKNNILGNNLFSSYKEDDLVGTLAVYPYMRSSNLDTGVETYCPLTFAQTNVVVSPYTEKWEFAIVSAFKVHSPDNTECYVVVNVSMSNMTDTDIAAHVTMEAQQTENIDGNVIVHGTLEADDTIVAYSSSVHTFTIPIDSRSQLEIVDRVYVKIVALGLTKSAYTTEVTDNA